MTTTPAPSLSKQELKMELKRLGLSQLGLAKLLQRRHDASPLAVHRWCLPPEHPASSPVPAYVEAWFELLDCTSDPQDAIERQLSILKEAYKVAQAKNVPDLVHSEPEFELDEMYLAPTPPRNYCEDCGGLVDGSGYHDCSVADDLAHQQLDKRRAERAAQAARKVERES